MNDDNMLDRIRRSSEQVEIPRSLEPDRIVNKLDGSVDRPGRPPRQIHIYRWAGAAAVFAVIFLLAGVYNGMIQGGSGSPETYLDKSGESESADAKRGSSIAPINDYDELYRALQKYDRESMEYAVAEDTVDSGSTEDAMVIESAPGSLPGAFTETAADRTESSSKEAGSYSRTNTRTEGVDEGDIVKTDGDYIYVLRQNEGIRIVDAHSMKVVKKLPLDSQDETFREMYVDNGILLVISSQTRSHLEEDGESAYYVNSEDTTTVYTYHISDPPRAALAGEFEQAGYYKSSRKNGRYLYLFTGYSPSLPEDPSEYEKYVPSAGGEMVGTADIFIPDICQSRDYLTVSAIDTEKPDVAVDTKAIVSGAADLYVSGSHIFIMNGYYGEDGEKTQIMSFAYQGTKIAPRAAGFVKGYLNDSFSIDEYKDHLRVVATYWDEKDGAERNGLYILDEDLKTVGKIEDIAPGETIQSARFMGDAGYFVTYRQMDPLFSVDLSDPRDPCILGELKITGFSEYLHFYGDGLLLGIGWETDPENGDTEGLKLSMFDISDSSKVVEKDKTVLKGVSYCTAFTDYKAVMADLQKNRIGFCYQAGEEGSSKTDSIYSVFRYDKGQGFTNEFTYSLTQLKGEVYPQIEDVRGLYIEDQLYLSSSEALIKFDAGHGYRTVEKLEF